MASIASVSPGIPLLWEVFNSNYKMFIMSLQGICRTQHPRNHWEENLLSKLPEYSVRTYIK